MAIVFPVFVTGHHCGPKVPATTSGSDCRLPGLRDRASLRPAQQALTDARKSGLPGLRDRASLRRQVVGAGPFDAGRLPGLRDRASLRQHAAQRLTGEGLVSSRSS